MHFLYPGFLFALAVVAIPIIIHLFNFRKYKKIFFTNVRYLQEIKQRTQSKSQLKHILVLASRILALSFLVFAFAQPYIPLQNQQIIAAENLISVYLDNSFSMEAGNSYGRLFDQAKNKALEVARSYQPTDRLQLLTNDFEARHQRLVNLEEFIEMVEEVEISSNVKKVSEIIARQGDALLKEGVASKQSYLISDFQQNNIDFESLKTDSGIRYTLLPLTPQQSNNLFIDSVWFESPIRQVNQADKVYVRIRNSSEKSQENIPVKLTVNGSQVALASCSVDAQSAQDVELSFTLSEPGIINACISIPDYPITFDDNFYFSYLLEKQIKILSINDTAGSDYLKSLYGSDFYFYFENINKNNLDYSKIPGFNLIILNNIAKMSSGLREELKKFLNNGGAIAVFPGLEIEIDDYNAFLQDNRILINFIAIDTSNVKIGKIDIHHQIFKDVFEKMPENIDFPPVYRHWILRKTGNMVIENLMVLNNGSDFLTRYKPGNGSVYIFTVPLSPASSSFPEHAIFVPVMYNIALYSQGSTRLYYTIGSDNRVSISGNLSRHLCRDEGGDAVYHLINNQDGKMKKFDIIPEIKLNGGQSTVELYGNIKEAGNYILLLEDQGLMGLSFNYNRQESALRCYDSEELEKDINDAGLLNIWLLESDGFSLEQKLSALNEGKKLWKLCVIFALAFFAVETALLRLWK